MSFLTQETFKDTTKDWFTKDWFSGSARRVSDCSTRSPGPSPLVSQPESESEFRMESDIAEATQPMTQLSPLVTDNLEDRRNSPAVSRFQTPHEAAVLGGESENCFFSEPKRLDFEDISVPEGTSASNVIDTQVEVPDRVGGASEAQSNKNAVFEMDLSDEESDAETIVLESNVDLFSLRAILEFPPQPDGFDWECYEACAEEVLALREGAAEQRMAPVGASSASARETRSAGRAHRSGKHFASPRVRERGIVIVRSGINQPSDQEAFDKFIGFFDDATEEDQIENATHLIVGTNDDPRLANTRNFKYFYAVVSGMWVVSIEWMKMCLKQRELLDEAGFEISATKRCIQNDGSDDMLKWRAPARGRCARESGDEKLFAKCVVSLSKDLEHSQHGLSYDECEKLLRAAGAEIVTRRELQRRAQKPELGIHYLSLAPSRRYGMRSREAETSHCNRMRFPEIENVSIDWLQDVCASYELTFQL